MPFSSILLVGGRRALLLVGLAGVMIASAAAPVSASTRYDPRLRFRTISTPRFDIHFHQGEEHLARRLALSIEEMAAAVDAAVGPPSGRVQVILVDQDDLSNGWASPLPYNTIEIRAAAPTAESSIGNVDDWIRLVFTHEYTHIAHLSRAKGWIAGLRRVFGRAPFLFPNLFQPIWGIEGIATWQESARTNKGRVLAGDFRLLLNEAAGTGRLEPLDRVNGGNVDWPSGVTPYLYGAYFHKYLADMYGDTSVRKLADETAARLPYLGSRAYKRVFNRSLGELWRDFEREVKPPPHPRADTLAVRLTHHGFEVWGPRYGPDGRVFYSTNSPHHFPTLMELSRPGEHRQVARRFLGNRIGIARERLVVDEIDVVRNVGLRSDLYSVDIDTGARRRITRDARAGDPDVSPDGARVVCTIQMADRRALATFELPRADPRADVVSPVLLINEPSTDFGAPRWSPNREWIAAERRELGRDSEIVLIDPPTGEVRRLASVPGGRSASPAWSPDGARVLFAAAVHGQPFRIFSVEIATGAVARLEGTGASAQSPDVSADGRSLVFVGYSVDGYDLFSIDLTEARWTPILTGSSPPEGLTDAGVPARATVAQQEHPYSAWRMLVPTFWTPTLESDADELVIGAATGSTDALGRHAYGVEAGWSARRRPDWQVGYAYDRWWPTLFGAISDDTDPVQGGEIRTLEADLGLILRTTRVRWTHTALLALHADRETFECASCTFVPAVETRRPALRTGSLFSNARAFGYSISQEEGGQVTATAEFARGTVNGSQGEATHTGGAVAFTVDARRYLRAGGQHAVVAMRAAAAASFGNEEAQRVFSASGSQQDTGGFRFGRDAIGLLRGFAQEEVTGTRAVVANVDYRIPLLRVGRGFGTIPLFVRRIHGAVFVDAGHAWIDRTRWSDARVSAGAELSVDTVLGFGLPVTLATGAAWWRDGSRSEQGLVGFGRIGRAF